MSMTLFVTPLQALDSAGTPPTLIAGFDVTTSEESETEVGEASYNIENCKDISDSDADNSDTDIEDDSVESIKLDECKKIVK